MSIKYLKTIEFSIFIILLNFHNTFSTLSDVLMPELTKTSEGRSPFSTPIRLAREIKYPRYASDNTDKNLKPEDSTDRDINNSPPGKRCISCFSGYPSYSYQPTYDRPRYNYDDIRGRDYDRYDDRDRYDRYSDRDRYYRGRDRYDRDRYYDPYDYDRYNSYDRYDRYNDRYDRYDGDRYNSDRGIGYDNRGYDYRYDPYRSSDDSYRYGRPDYGTSGYANRWNYGNSGSDRDDYYNRDRYPNYRPTGKDPYNRDPYNDTYRPTSYLYGRPSSTTLKPPTEDPRTQSPQENSG
ncbi:eukaryotic translation initiation factor 4B isoform X2 [Diorhabda carinulata]|uniref:eukaryotic translation initiation factor 4B isoform X2 n=1 Tax=Diorhabda carinulata TaxID=1163345 RepID=UPI0025A243CE|nr:eukaryotic translation initiation factor 4B isoform X2 [Diorhabda carinulata]